MSIHLNYTEQQLSNTLYLPAAKFDGGLVLPIGAYGSVNAPRGPKQVGCCVVLQVYI